MTSAGQIVPVRVPPYFIVIDRALRDEGTSYHYLPPSDYSVADAHLAQIAREALTAAGISVQVGAITIPLSARAGVGSSQKGILRVIGSGMDIG
jgi:uridine phosphorylase